jgi:hypothetical protein
MAESNFAKRSEWDEHEGFQGLHIDDQLLVYKDYFDRTVANDRYRKLDPGTQRLVFNDFLAGQGVVRDDTGQSMAPAPQAQPTQAPVPQQSRARAIDVPEETPSDIRWGNRNPDPKTGNVDNTEYVLPVNPQGAPGPLTKEMDYAAIEKFEEDRDTPRPSAMDPGLYAGADEKSRGFGKRRDGTDKGDGFLGILKRPDGRVSTELAIGITGLLPDGKEIDIPSIVSTSTKEEVETLLNLQEGEQIPRPIVDKAVAHARERIKAGKSPFAGPEDYNKTTSPDAVTTTPETASVPTAMGQQGMGIAPSPLDPRPVDILNAIKERKDVSWPEIGTKGGPLALENVARSNAEAIKASAEALKRQIESRQVESPESAVDPTQPDIPKPVGRPNTPPPSGKGFYDYATIPKDIITKDRTEAINLLDRVSEHLGTESILAKPDKNFEYKKRLENSGFGKRLTNDVVGVLPQLIEMGVASAVGGPLLSTAAIFSQILGSSYPQYLEKAKGDKDRAFAAAFANATLQAPMEQIAFSKVKSIFNLKSPFAKKLRTWIEGGATEAVTEYAQTAPEKGAEIYAEGPETQSIGEILSELGKEFGTWDYQKDALYQSLVGGIAGGVMGAPGLITRPQAIPPQSAQETESEIPGQPTQTTAIPLPDQMDVVPGSYAEVVKASRASLESGEITVAQLEARLFDDNVPVALFKAHQSLLKEYKDKGETPPSQGETPTPAEEPSSSLPIPGSPPAESVIPSTDKKSKDVEDLYSKSTDDFNSIWDDYVDEKDDEFEIYRRSDGKIHTGDIPKDGVAELLRGASTSAGLNLDQAITLIKQAVKNNREDVAAFVVARMRRSADNMNSAPGFEKSDPRYDEIKKDLENRKKVAYDEAKQVENLFRIQKIEKQDQKQVIPDLGLMAMPELRALAEKEGVAEEIKGPKSKQKLIDAIEAKRLEQGAESEILPVPKTTEVVDDKLTPDSILKGISKRVKAEIKMADSDGNVTTEKVNAKAELEDLNNRNEIFNKILDCMAG